MTPAHLDIRAPGKCWARCGPTTLQLGIGQELKPDGDAPQPRGWFDADVAKDVKGKEAIVVHGGLAEGNSRLGDVWIMEVL